MQEAVTSVIFSPSDMFQNPPLLYFSRPSARFPQHRRKKRKEMDEGIPESNQHKQSKLGGSFGLLKIIQ